MKSGAVEIEVHEIDILSDSPTPKFEIGEEIEQEPAEGQIESEDVKRLREMRERLDLPVSVLDPSVRAENCLAAENIRHISDLVRRGEPEMLKVRNFGKTSLKEIKKKLADMGLSFGMDLSNILDS